jgi:hypothetical protein
LAATKGRKKKEKKKLDLVVPAGSGSSAAAFGMVSEERGVMKQAKGKGTLHLDPIE